MSHNHAPHTGGQHNNHGEHPTHAQIAELAYSYYVERGRQDGHDLDDWFQAEQQLKLKHHQ